MLGLSAVLALSTNGLAQKKDAGKAPRKAAKMAARGEEKPLPDIMKAIQGPFQNC